MSSAATSVANPPTPKHPTAPRRCFICLTDQDTSEPDSAWVNPCPCTLEAHHDCMLSWVTDCERTGKELICPVCKYHITMEGPWDPVVAFEGALRKRFSRASPYILCTAVFVGVNFSLQMYGATAMSMFVGREQTLRFLVSGGGMKEKIKNLAILTNIAPALIVAELFPALTNKVCVPIASAYGMYHFVHDDKLISWPPSPQLAIATFPLLRSVYYSLYREFVLPYEVKLNRQIMGLPPTEQPQPNRPERRGGENQQGGLIGLLQGLLDAFEAEDDEGDAFNIGGNVQIQAEIQAEEVQPGDENQGNDIMVEVVIEEVEDEDEDNIPELPGNELPAIEVPGDQRDDAPVQQDQEQDPAEDGHEAPRAPAQRQGLGTLLTSISNSLAGSLLLPGISYLIGEALRYCLPRSWTTIMPGLNFGASRFVRPGLLQQQWGRSLIGGCLYIVIQDMVRVYAKHRKVALTGHRKVKNVTRKGRR